MPSCKFFATFVSVVVFRGEGRRVLGGGGAGQRVERSAERQSEGDVLKLGVQYALEHATDEALFLLIQSFMHVLHGVLENAIDFCGKPEQVRKLSSP